MMNHRGMATGAIAVLALWTLAGMAGASDTSFDPDGTCDGDEPANVKCAIVAGPASITHKLLLSAGLGICTDTGLPLACDATPGALAGAGAAIFNVSDWANGNHIVDLWVEHIPGAVPCLPATEVCGFQISLCNDRDIDATCTNVGDDSDQLFDAESNEAAIGADCTDDKKDEKDCGDDLDAQIVDKCLAPAEQPPATADWNNGQIVVFIGAWVDTHPTDPNIGAGVSAGSYEVWLEDFGAGDPACTPSPNEIFNQNEIEPPVCTAQVTDPDPTVAAELGEAHTRACVPAACVPPQPVFPGPVAPYVLTVVCTANNACDGKMAIASASRPMGIVGDTVSAKLECGAGNVISMTPPVGGVGPVAGAPGPKLPLKADYICTITFTVAARPMPPPAIAYQASGQCWG